VVPQKLTRIQTLALLLIFSNLRTIFFIRCVCKIFGSIFYSIFMLYQYDSFFTELKMNLTIAEKSIDG